MRRAVRHVDAFTSVPLEGNPAAVVDGEGLGTETMQRIALNQKLSETVYLLPPADPANHARLRIFTPAKELPFAGHPTIAAAHILVEEARVKPGEGESLRLETGAGVIPVAVEGAPPRYTMTQARPSFRAAGVGLDVIAAALGVSPADIAHMEYVSTGIEWLLVQLVSLDAMMGVRPDMLALMQHDVAVFCIGAAAPGVDVHVRAFAPGGGIYEDPVTGSANGCIAALIGKRGLLPSRDGEIAYVAEQGAEMGQPGRVYARVTGAPRDPLAHIGGHAVTVLRGELLLPG